MTEIKVSNCAECPFVEEEKFYKTVMQCRIIAKDTATQYDSHIQWLDAFNSVHRLCPLKQEHIIISLNKLT